MKPTTYLFIAGSIFILHQSVAQSVPLHRQRLKPTGLVLTRHVPGRATKSVVKPMPLTPTANVPTTPDSSRTKLPIAGPTGTSATIGDASGLAVSGNSDQLATPKLVQALGPKPYLMPLDKASVRGSYPLGISATKTTHLIFPSKIREFDAGTDYVLAQVPESVANVLRVKANDKSEFCAPGSTIETNMTIITDDGNLYSFIVRHQADPEVLNVNIANNQWADEQTSRAQGISQATAVPVILSSAKRTGNPIANRAEVSDTDMRHDCQRILERKGFIRRVGTSTMKVSSRLKGVYVNGKVMYLQLALTNKSNIDYDVDFIKFYLRDREQLKRTAAQEVELAPYLTHPNDLRTVKANTNCTAVYALPLRTVSDDKVLEVELYERDGGRQLRYRIADRVLLKARGV